MVAETWLDAGLSPTKRWKCFGGDQLVFAHDSGTTGTAHGILRLRAAAGRQAALAGPVLSLGPHLHVGECDHQGGLPARRGRARHGHRRARHLARAATMCRTTRPTTSARARASTSTRRRRRGPKHFQMYDYIVQELTALVARAFPVNYRALRHHRPFHGRPRRAQHRAQEPAIVSVGLGVRADRRAEPGARGARRRSTPISATRSDGLEPSTIPAP